ncbi:DUF3054 domain-containing protein [Pedococcus sp. KACC 23699]|uniref:DUF3054 domain-containing protein n=1 Tax=Pedococcus sp. KACC 23699 TaxID=3149228 RepID=A0AAU7JTL0_9MICO
MRRVVPAFLLDAAAVLLFATIGRASHEEGVTLGGVLLVAWPFLAALALGWALARARGAWPTGLPGSVVVWLTTVVVGLCLRVATGGGFAWSFAVVTLVVLGLFVVGWRCVREVGRFVGEGLARWSHEREAERSRAARGSGTRR